MLNISWHKPFEGEIQEAQTSKYQLTSNSCALTTLMIEKETKQRFNYITAKSIKCNINNEYNSSLAVKRVLKYKRTEKNKRKIKQQKKTAFILD